MPTTIEVTAYTLDELSVKAKEKAREWYKSDGNAIDNEQISDDFKETLKEAGFSDAKAWYNLNYCQGDGVDFESNPDASELYEKQKLLHEQIAAGRYVASSEYDTRHVGEGVVVGALVISGLGYENVDANNVAIKNAKGGYDTHSYVRVVGHDEDFAGYEVTEVKPLPNGKVRVVIQGDKRNDKYTERLRAMACDAAMLASLKDLLDRSITLSIKVEHSRYSRYHHWNSMNVTVEVTDYADIEDATFQQDVDNQALSIEESIKSLAKDLSRLMEREGYAMIESANSDEVVDDTIMANEYLFTVEGKRCHVL
jgi:hypothetical protein